MLFHRHHTVNQVSSNGDFYYPEHWFPSFSIWFPAPTRTLRLNPDIRVPELSNTAKQEGQSCPKVSPHGSVLVSVEDTFSHLEEHLPSLQRLRFPAHTSKKKKKQLNGNNCLLASSHLLVVTSSSSWTTGLVSVVQLALISSIFWLFSNRKRKHGETLLVFFSSSMCFIEWLKAHNVAHQPVNVAQLHDKVWLSDDSQWDGRFISWSSLPSCCESDRMKPRQLSPQTWLNTHKSTQTSTECQSDGGVQRLCSVPSNNHQVSQAGWCRSAVRNQARGSTFLTNKQFFFFFALFYFLLSTFRQLFSNLFAKYQNLNLPFQAPVTWKVQLPGLHQPLWTAQSE